MPYDEEGNETFPKLTTMGSSFTSGIVIDFLSLIEEEERE